MTKREWNKKLRMKIREIEIDMTVEGNRKNIFKWLFDLIKADRRYQKREMIKKWQHFYLTKAGIKEKK